MTADANSRSRLAPRTSPQQCALRARNSSLAMLNRILKTPDVQESLKMHMRERPATAEKVRVVRMHGYGAIAAPIEVARQRRARPAHEHIWIEARETEFGRRQAR